MNNKFLKNIILDLVDGVWTEADLAEQFGMSDKQARQIWKSIEEIRAENKSN